MTHVAMRFKGEVAAMLRGQTPVRHVRYTARSLTHAVGITKMTPVIFRFRLFACVIAAAVGSGCGTLKERAEAVQITASPTEVSRCKHVGPVLLGTVDSEFDQRQRDLKFETARQGGNVLLVHSFATATHGQAYVCDEPLNPNRVAS